MAIKGSEEGSYYLVEVGELFTAKTLLEVRKVVEDALTAGHQNLVFDLSECARVDSSAIGIVTNVAKKCKANGGKVGVLGAAKDIREIFEIANADEDVGFYQSIDQYESNL